MMNQVLTSWLLATSPLACASSRRFCVGSSVFSESSSAMTRLSERHMLFAWVSLIWVGLTDVYVRLLSMGVIRDVRFF